jgi:hypothetical protein
MEGYNYKSYFSANSEPVLGLRISQRSLWRVPLTQCDVIYRGEFSFHLQDRRVSRTIKEQFMPASFCPLDWFICDLEDGTSTILWIVNKRLPDFTTYQALLLFSKLCLPPIYIVSHRRSCPIKSVKCLLPLRCSERQQLKHLIISHEHGCWRRRGVSSR